MSKTVFNYLTESPFFEDRLLETFFENMSDEQLIKQLADYRKYILDQLAVIYKESNQNGRNITVTMEGFNSYKPTEDFLKQCSLYIDTVLVNDPLFEFSAPNSSVEDVMKKYLGFNSDEIDRKKLVDSIRYMKRVTPGVVSDFIKFVPLSYIHEAPKELPIFASDNYFADILPQNLLDWFRERVSVKSLTKEDNGWKVENHLNPARGIIVEFDNHTGKGMIYQLFEQEVVKIDQETRKVLFKLELPNDPPEKKYFDAWVFQSINRASESVCKQILTEARNASVFGNSYLTTSQFSTDLLNLLMGSNKKIGSDIGNLVLYLDLPVINSISFSDLMTIRQNEGDAFSNFRICLEKQLRELRDINDPEKIKIKLSNVAHELEQVQINDIRKKVDKIKRNTLSDLLIITASLGASYFGVSTLLSTFGAGWGVNQLRTRYNEYISDVKEAPAYFLWKIKNKQ